MVADVSTNCPMLSVLCMSKCDSVTDEALAMLSRGCPMLTFVSHYDGSFVCWSTFSALTPLVGPQEEHLALSSFKFQVGQGNYLIAP